MKLILSFLTVAFFSVTGTETFKGYNSGIDTGLSWELAVNNGMLNGPMKSYSQSGTLELEGNFENNLKSGEWKMYDYEGKLCMVMHYEKGVLQKITDVKNAKGETMQAPVVIQQKITRNAKNLIQWDELKEKEIVWTKRLWRMLEPGETNQVFFGDNKFFGHIFKQVHAGKLKVYDTSSDEFKKELSPEEMKAMIPKGNFDVVGWKIKEDWFYRKGKQYLEARVVGMCPVIKNKTGNAKPVDLFWIYYPDARECLAGYTVSATDDNRIQQADDVFYFRHFAGKIYKESNVYNRSIAAYAKGDQLKTEPWRIEADLWKFERTRWLEILGHE